ncbi:hypothetical protein [Pseudomonas helleri]|uniref:Uncharacterized protein n=1 Tax=Pseudomonas helleri TaxID=1608996 RepID=A0A6L5HWX2_9PSED|nr:hypothetical protein [Pseudomonas helleri]MQU07753.1 hypothetical protein [Pseudomonas helleri]
MSTEIETKIQDILSEVEKKTVSLNRAKETVDKATTLVQTETSKLGTLSRVIFKGNATEQDLKLYQDQDTKLGEAESSLKKKDEAYKAIATAIADMKKEIATLQFNSDIDDQKVASKATVKRVTAFVKFVLSITGATTLEEAEADIKTKFTPYQ